MIEIAPSFKAVIPLLEIGPEIVAALKITIALLVLVAIIDMSARQLKAYSHVLFASFLLFAGITLYLMTELVHVIGPSLGLRFSGQIDVLKYVFTMKPLAEILTLYAILFLIFGSVMAIGRMLTKEGPINDVFIDPILEEILYRYLLIGFFVSMRMNMFEAAGVSALLFSLAPNRLLGGITGDWHGFYKPISAFIFGIFLGLFAIKFGLLFAIFVHMLWGLMDYLAVPAPEA